MLGLLYNFLKKEKKKNIYIYIYIIVEIIYCYKIKGDVINARGGKIVFHNHHHPLHYMVS